MGKLVSFFCNVKKEEMSISKNTVNENIETNTNNINILNDTIKTLLDHIYPVGSIYMNVNSIDPNTTLGGTWGRIYDRFLIGGGKDYTIGTTGGEKEHKLTVAEMPSHNHDFSIFNYGNTKI